MSSPLTFIVNTTLLGLVTLPALILTVLLFRRTSGSRHEPSRKWVTYTKVAFVLYSLVNILTLIITGVNTSSDSYYYGYYSPSYLALLALSSISIPIGHVGSAAVFLALFYLARAFSLHRTDETSKRYRIGRQWALGAFIWVCLASLTVMCLSISIFAARYANTGYNNGPDYYDGIRNRSIAASSFDLALFVTHLICAIGTMVYVAKARRKVLGTPLQKASNLMLTCAILWLLRNVWSLLFSILWGFMYGFAFSFMYSWGYIFDMILNNWMTFVILVLLYVLATTDKYAMSQPQEQERRPKSMDEEAF
ncbi:hypothetical protein CI238_03181 [Colletotrichum incanum]|uniref:Uncharacterized protein n=1 Tax=Colletotrichum incanum TaxID=1573173 RepID=A0A167CE54_COLIC|nr:hypothetical protein CI238_03181 [Colletotrichum incanum]OHW97979.1 hypothetical protein CSPAE12_03351 [Colletotrichum incanum]